MWKRIDFVAGTGLVMLFVLSAPASVQGADCFRSSECAGSSICMNLSCVAAALDSCETSADCDYDEECIEGFCKPAGVSCSNDVGQCSADVSSGSCSCLNGSGSGWATDSSGDMDGDVTPDMPPVEVPSDEELYAECRQILVMDCGTEAPDLSAVCTDEQLTTCTQFMLTVGAMEEACEDYWGDNDEPVSSPPSSGSSDDVEDSGSDVATGDGEGDSASSAGEEDVDSDVEEMPMPAPDPEGEWPRVFLQETANPWDVAECCEELQEAAEEADPEYQAFIDEYLACVLALEEEDCDGYMACEEAMEYGEEDSIAVKNDREEWGGDADGDADEGGDTIGLDDDGEAAPGDGAVVPPTAGDGTESDADSAGQDQPAPEPGGDNSGCSFAPVSTGSTIVTLLKALF